MKVLVFDTSTIITLSLNNLLHILPDLKHRFNGQFLITEDVKREIIDKPLSSRRFKLEALQIQQLILDGTLEIYGQSIEKQTQHLLNLSNSIFKAKGNYIKLVDKAEVESLVLASLLQGTYVVDERTMRMLVEDPEGLKEIFKRKLHTNIAIDKNNLNELQKEIKVNIIRSSELVTVAYSKGMLNNLTKKDHLSHENLKKELLDGLLWGAKLNGCAITEQEIKQIERIEGF